MNISFCEKVANYAVKAILYEVSTTPKPGLVDRNNPGAHDDMDFYTFIDSVSVLYPYYYNCTKAGLNFDKSDYLKLMEEIRPLGIKAEKDMFDSTKGVNTHKGMVFSIGIICAAVGSIYGEDESMDIEEKYITKRVMDMTEGISKELYHLEGKENLTYGEQLYKKYGVKGIRGEVEDGFPTVIDNSLPLLKRLIEEDKYTKNQILLHTLLKLIETTEDSNVLGRHDIETLRYVQEQGKIALELGGGLTEEGQKFIENMDKDFIDKNISSGGAADLLSVTLLYYFIENGDF